MTVSVMIKIVYLSAAFTLLTKNSEAFEDKTKRVRWCLLCKQ